MKLSSDHMAVVTGGASGMGQAMVEKLANQGIRSVILDINEQGQQVAEANHGIYHACDVTDADCVETIFAKIIEEKLPIRMAINCAGIAPAKRTVGRDGPMALDAFSKVIQVNLIGTFNVTRMAAYAISLQPILEEGERGVIINTASVAAYEGQIGQAAYSASKGGIVSMTLPLAREFASLGIRINTIAPGLIATPLLLNMPQEVQDALAATVTFPKRLGKPTEFAALALHVVENEMINGEVLRLDGALRMAAK